MATSNYFEVNQHTVPFAIEAMACLGEKIFVATANRHMLTYSVKLNPKVEFNLVKHDYNFASQKIIQMETATLFDNALLFSLSSNLIKVHEINTKSDIDNVYSSYKVVHAGNQTIGATAFAINKKVSAENSMLQLCTIAGETIRFFNWKANILQQQYKRFVKLESAPRQIMWYKSSIYIGFSTGFAIYDVSLFKLHIVLFHL